AAHCRLTEPAPDGHRAGAPVRGVARLCLQGQAHHFLHLGIVDRARDARTWFIEQSVDPPRQEPRAPFADRLLRQPQLARDLGIRLARRTPENDARALRQRLGGARASRPALQRLSLGVADAQWRNRTARAHVRSPFYRKNATRTDLV